MEQVFDRPVPCAADADDASAVRAAELFYAALERRLRVLTPRGTPTDASPVFLLETDPAFPSEDGFEISAREGGLLLRAKALRGLIYAFGLILRKSTFKDGAVTLQEDICSVHVPVKNIRGHQLGYRPCSNTYDAWDVADFETYMLELMYFGMNTVEFIPFTEHNALMKYDGVAMTAKLSGAAHALGLKVSLWIPNGREDEDTELAAREALFAAVPFIDAVFIPGADPGDLPPETLIDRCKKIYSLLHKYHPGAELWPSAQAPHDSPDWGGRFLRALDADAGEIAGVITGPNRAFPLEELRRRLPEKYPVRFYPDITHNLRCEHPVHFDRDDWHYAFAACLSRESINPRPKEYKRLFELVSPYTVGSVTYSDGVNDDVNKAVWCALEWDPGLSAEEIAEDYARAYLYQYDTEAVAAGILLLEKNWEGSPLEKRVDFTAHVFDCLAQRQNDWRFDQLRFRATSDLYIKQRMLEDSAAAGAAAALIQDGQSEAAAAALEAPPSERIRSLRDDIGRFAALLRDKIGMQLSVEGFGASGWERGATLDTIDLPVTDRAWLLHVLKTAGPETAERAVHRNDAAADEYYYSVALHGPNGAGAPQTPDFYINVLGDRPDVNDGTLPVCLFKAFDHFRFHARQGGFTPGIPYYLTVTYYKTDAAFLSAHTVTVNGERLAPPSPAAGFAALLPERFIAYTYYIPANLNEDGVFALEIAEPQRGFQLAELRITKRQPENDIPPTEEQP